MKKSFVVFFIVLTFLMGNAYVASEKNNVVFKEEDTEMKGIILLI